MAVQCCVRCTTENRTPCAWRALYGYSPVYKWVLKQNKTKEEAKWRTKKKKTGKTWCSTSTVPSSHATTERAREREQSHASAPVTASRPALSRKRKRNSSAHKQCIFTHSAALRHHTHSHSPDVSMSTCSSITVSSHLLKSEQPNRTSFFAVSKVLVKK